MKCGLQLFRVIMYNGVAEHLHTERALHGGEH